MNKRTAFTTILCLILAAASCFGSHIRVLGLSQVKGLEQLEILARDVVEVVPVSISSVSQEIEIPESGRLDFYLKAPQDPKPEDISVTPVLSVDFDDVDSDMILLLRANESGTKPGYNYLLIDASERDLSLIHI